jgi:hypothetical protein
MEQVDTGALNTESAECMMEVVRSFEAVMFWSTAPAVRFWDEEEEAIAQRILLLQELLIHNLRAFIESQRRLDLIQQRAASGRLVHEFEGMLGEIGWCFTLLLPPSRSQSTPGETLRQFIDTAARLNSHSCICPRCGFQNGCPYCLSSQRPRRAAPL